MMTKAAVLCGGQGRRLQPLTNYFQKTMVPIGARRKPLLEYIVRLLAHYGVHDITMLTGYRDEEIVNYFGDGSRFEAKISYSKDADAMKGSAGALSNALRSHKIGNCDNLVVYYGDILSNLKVNSLTNVHVQRKADATLVLTRGYTLPVGVAEVSGEFITSLKEKPSLQLNVTTGNMVLSKRALRILKESPRNIVQGDLMRNFVPLLLVRKYRVASYFIDDFWYDVGTIDKYQDLTDKIVEKHLGFLDRY
jgi:mannose-1-phosphate guanylyltransferase